MAEFKIKLNRKEVITIYILSGLFILEFLLLIAAIYYEKFPIILSLFIEALRLLSPVFLGLNFVFIIATMLVRGRDMIVKPWKTYLQEVLRFSVVSSIMTIILIVAVAFLAVLFDLLLRQISNIPAVEGTITSLRDWVDRNFY
ncbi:MAG: hypothetical protein JW734_01610 [Candidatus Omnitrophica bacterium]|nr:hypothetical protein [Candidatus Omnitrophota bacterium]